MRSTSTSSDARARATSLCGLAAVFMLVAASAAEPPPTLPEAEAPRVSVGASSDDAPSSLAETVAAYEAMVASRARDTDRTQDISVRQLLILLEVCERTGLSLGQALATGEFESAHTWNDHIRPTLSDGRLGSATGVWQFIPATFHDILRRYGAQLLAASDAAPALGRRRLDLRDGPFSDAEVRELIQETVDGQRGADDGAVQLLRHNFAVLAFAKHYLSLDSGATTPEEDYLFHFLGAREGKRILALARGEARDTLCVKSAGEPAAPVSTAPTQASDADRAAAMRAAILRARSVRESASALRLQSDLGDGPRVSAQWGLTSTLQRPRLTSAIGLSTSRGRQEAEPALSADSAIWSPSTSVSSRASSAWGLPADSRVVTGNLGMFYRDGTGRTDPYTWAEFIDHLGGRVRAKDQPALVRAKYGVGFTLKGGDMPAWAFDPDTTSEVGAFRHALSGEVSIAKPLVMGPLTASELRQYKARLASLLVREEDQPLETLPPEAVSALRHLGLLPGSAQAHGNNDSQVRKALRGFRRLVGKSDPDDPDDQDRLMPAERVALEIYDQRIAHYAALQAAQRALLSTSPVLGHIRSMPIGLRKAAAVHIAVLQTLLAERGLLKQPTRKIVWRDKRRKRHVRYETVPFVGYPGKLTEAALDTFQWRHGLLRTEGVLDGVTLGMLGLPPMGTEIFLPLSGPQCPIDTGIGAGMCEVQIRPRRQMLSGLVPIESRSAPRF